MTIPLSSFAQLFVDQFSQDRDFADRDVLARRQQGQRRRGQPWHGSTRAAIAGLPGPGHRPSCLPGRRSGLPAPSSYSAPAAPVIGGYPFLIHYEHGEKMGVELTAVLPSPEAEHQVCTTMILTLSIDNRLLDGATGALFLPISPPCWNNHRGSRHDREQSSASSDAQWWGRTARDARRDATDPIRRSGVSGP